MPVSGRPLPRIEDGRPVRTVALLGRDYGGLKPRMLVQAGDKVTIGQPLFVDKRDPAVKFTAPGSGTVAAINRGARRVLLSVAIDLDPECSGSVDAASLSIETSGDLDAESIRVALCETGLWTAFKARPFNKVPQSDSTPRSIFVTAIDTNPLAVNPVDVVVVDPEAFETGLGILSRLTEGNVYLCSAPDWSGPNGDPERVIHATFAGPHPAGLAGTHIHHLDPVGVDRTVWHIGYQDVMAIGRLFGKGVLSMRRVISLGGEGFEKPRLIATRAGASIDELIAGEVAHGAVAGNPHRIISGSVLSGRRAHGGEAFLGRYHLQVCAVPEGGERHRFGWLSRGYTFSGLLRRQKPAVVEGITTSMNGLRNTFFPVESFEKLIPLDILPGPLLRALMIKDTDQAQALGCLELDAEDLALCSFVCPGKVDYGAILDVNLEQIEREG